MNRLYFGDNLHVLRDHLATESVDLIYLDPPFNSKRDYNLLFKSPKVGRVTPMRAGLGQADDGAHGVTRPATDYSEAQITAFEDSWHWGEQAEREFDELVHAPNTDVSEMMQALRRFLGENDMMAYLTMMANRLLELHRVLKPTGSLYLHCDPTASHYLKIVLDGVFGKTQFRNEISWRRTGAHNSAKRYGANHDIILFYTKDESWTWNQQFTPLSEKTIKKNYHYRDAHGPFQVSDLTANKPGGDVSYDWETPTGQIVRPYKGRYWAYSKKNMQEFEAKGLLYYRSTGMPKLKHYLEDMPGVPMQDFWDNIGGIVAGSGERLPYPTQKPLALLERIIAASSNEGDVVLDPFCGCGTAVHAAQKLKRQWIGIDITHLAISLIEKRLKDAFGAVASGSARAPRAATDAPSAAPPGDGSREARESAREGARAPQSRLEYEVHGTPKDLDAARDLATRDKYQFQWWAVSLVEAQPFQGRKKGADTGIDGLKFFGDYVVPEAKSKNAAQIHKTGKMVVSVKGGGIKADDVRALNHVREREGAEIGLFISLEEPTRGMIADAASAGFYQDGAGRKFPRVQLLTIEGLLSGTHRAEHPDHQPDLNFKKARAEANAQQKELL